MCDILNRTYYMCVYIYIYFKAIKYNKYNKYFLLIKNYIKLYQEQ